MMDLASGTWMDGFPDILMSKTNSTKMTYPAARELILLWKWHHFYWPAINISPPL
jgi:hypothetical protein